MTWSLRPNLIRTEPPHVLWNDVFLRALPDEDFKAAIRAAEAFGDDIVESIGTPDQQPHGNVNMAAHVVGAVVKEMTRRNWDSNEGPKQDA